MVTLPTRGPAPALAVSLALGPGLAILAFVAFVASCYGPSADGAPAQPAAASSAGPASGPDATGDDGAASPVAIDGLPCDVARVLAASCTDCHGRPLRSGAPMPLLSYADLSAPSKSDPARSVAALSVARITDARRPMPPDEVLAASDVAVLARWVDAGSPRAACLAEPPDAALVEDAGADGAEPPFDAAGSEGGDPCTSGARWTGGAPASALMHPGRACIACHAASGGPSIAVAGTVYTALQEPDDCNGTSAGPLGVLIIDAMGQPHTLPVNAAGNFLRVTRIPVPYRAMVVRGTEVREMRTPQTDGDCNGCHSVGGDRAPGRILAP